MWIKKGLCFINNDRAQLSKYRMEKAKEDLNVALYNMEKGFLKAAVNRSYYAILHAIRAILAF